jgi:hypothetical protein
MSTATAQQNETRPDTRNAMPIPAYAPYTVVRRHLAAVPRRVVLGWVYRGWVRSVKLSDSRQAGRLFNTADLADCLERLAGGYAPRTRNRRRGIEGWTEERTSARKSTSDGPAVAGQPMSRPEGG